MYWYALIGVLAAAVLMIENFEILFSTGDSQKFPEIRIYRKFLYGILAYYITDILWGVLDSLGLTALLFLDTEVYYVAMAVGVLFWTQYVVTYLGGDDLFSRFLFQAGRFFFAAVVLCTVLNFFVPVLFWFDGEGVYHACAARHVQLLFQIVLLLLTSVYTLRAIPRAEGSSRARYRIIFFFGLSVAALLLIQIPYPFLPLYTVGYMMGSSLLHTFVVSNEMDELLLRQSELAIAANKAKSAFLSNMSHEIRTPINGILGMNEMVLRESRDPEVQTYAENIRTAGNTLLGIVNDVLDFSKIEAGKMELNPVDYELASLINDLVIMVQGRAEEKGLELKLSLNPDLPRMLHGDEIRIRQVITNILSNAVKYTEKGSVTFAMDFERENESGDSVSLNVSVSDTGIGIRQEDMDKLFSEFDRIEEKRNRNIEGTGLGMTITKRLLAMMGSNLDVRSVYGEGSVFSFRLKQPVVSWERLGNYEDSFRSSLARREKYRARFFAPDAAVMMADDNPMNLMVFRSLLKETGIQIDTVESGDACLALCREKLYDIIFLDHMMPVKDGIETLHELRAEQSNPNRFTPAVCLTANAISGAREQYLREGFDDYLAKPIDSFRLEDMIMLHLPEQKIRPGGEEPRNGGDGDREIPEILQRVRELDGIDVSQGIKGCGGLEDYLALLRVFCATANRSAGEIRDYYETENWKDYTIRVHALKSSARSIGAMDFGEEAQRLENAGKNGDLAYIRANHGAFLADYLGFRDALAGIFAEEDLAAGTAADETADRETMEALYARIREAADEMDIDGLERILGGMSAGRVPVQERERWSRLTEAVGRYDYDGIAAVLDGDAGS